jgi:hypothetical protein
MQKADIMESKKKNISLRMSQTDIDRVRLIARRLEVKESDILRFAIKQMLTRMAPFQEDSYRGKDLMPALLAIGEELSAYFELTGVQLDHIVNDGVSDELQKVEQEDLTLLALSSVNQEYARLKVNAYNDMNTRGGAAGLKEYLTNKYFNTVGKASRLDTIRSERTPFIQTSEVRRTVSKTA